jgi:GxxExxY protein
MNTDSHRLKMLEFEPEDETPFPHKEITEAIIGSAFEVYNHLGYGFLHRVYQRSLQVELARRGFSGDLEKRTTVRYKEVIVGEYDSDMIINDAVLEVKIAPQYDKRDEAQLLNVLKATGVKVGILLNFGRYKVEYKRPVF